MTLPPIQLKTHVSQLNDAIKITASFDQLSVDQHLSMESLQYMLAVKMGTGYLKHLVAKNVAGYLLKSVEEAIEQQLDFLPTYPFVVPKKLPSESVWAKSVKKEQLDGAAAAEKDKLLWASTAHPQTKDFLAKLFDPKTFADMKAQMAAEEAKMAALWGATHPPTDFNNPSPRIALEKAIPGLKGARAQCPQCRLYYDEASERPVASVIIELNDSHNWTRERIADWLDTLDVDLSFKTPEGGDKE